MSAEIRERRESSEGFLKESMHVEVSEVVHGTFSTGIL